MTITIKNINPIWTSLKRFSTANRRATNDAMNRAHIHARKLSSTAMRSEWKGLSADRAKKAIKEKKSKVSDLSTKMILQSRPISLSSFGAKWSKKTPTGKKTKGVSYKLKGKRRTMKGSFIAKGQMFSRKKNGGLRRHASITPTNMWKGVGAEEIYLKAYEERFRSRYDQQLLYRLFKK